MFAHPGFGHVMMPDGIPFLFKLLLVIAAIFVVWELRRRDARLSRTDDAGTVALLEELKGTLARLEDRVENLEALLPGERRKDGQS